MSVLSVVHGEQKLMGLVTSYWDNVGGETLDATLFHSNTNMRVIVRDLLTFYILS